MWIKATDLGDVSELFFDFSRPARLMDLQHAGRYMLFLDKRFMFTEHATINVMRF